jgi:hypothetical protein
MTELEGKINAWHEEAMDLAELAFFAKRKKEIYNYWKFIQRALNYEKAAARLLKNENEIDDPTRAILYQGAIHFALNLDYLDEARQLLNEGLDGFAPHEIKNEFERIKFEILSKERARSRILAFADNFLNRKSQLEKTDIDRAIRSAITAEALWEQQTEEDLSKLLNRIALQVYLENKNLVINPDYQIFDNEKVTYDWLDERKSKITWPFWKAYKVFLDKKNFAGTTIKKLDELTDDILLRIGDPSKGGVWDKRGMIVGDVQSGKTSNYIGLINKAADLGFRIIIIFSGLYESLRQQTQERIDEGFVGIVSDLSSEFAGNAIGVELYRDPKKIPVHPITRSGEAGDLRKTNLPNLSLNTNDHYAIVVKKNPFVLKALLNWLYARADRDGQFKIIKNIPLLVIDDEADYASLNVDKDFVSKINGSIRATLALFEQSAFIGYTATPFANVFISDYNETKGKEIYIDDKLFRLGEDLFPRDFIINIAPPSNYLGYSKIFDTKIKITDDYVEGDLPMLNIINDYESYIPQGHTKGDPLTKSIPPSLESAIKCFFLVCSIRLARGQQKEHNSMLIHVSWYVNWIDNIALLVNNYVAEAKKKISENDSVIIEQLRVIFEKEFKSRTGKIVRQLDYNDPRLIEHDWEEIEPFLGKAIEKIEVRAVHGAKKDLKYKNNKPLDYKDYRDGLSVIAVGGNKLSRGLTLEGLSISYFLRASRFYDTLLQMGRWFGYRPGYADLCRLFTTKELIDWYQYIGNATEELKEQFDIMDLAERTPKNFGLKVRSAPGLLMISSAAKLKGATDLSLSYSGDLVETYVLSKSDGVLGNNIRALHGLIERLGRPSGITRQKQQFIWHNLSYKQVDDFIDDYQINQPSINSNYLRGYIGQQLKNGHLNDWTVVLINNSAAKESYKLGTSHGDFYIGYTFRNEVETEDILGNLVIDPEKYFIRKSHIISPPHEYLDMDETDQRLINAKEATQKESKAQEPPSTPSGKFIRKYRGAKNVLLIIYVLDPKGFGGKNGIPAIGYAISFPEIENDEKIPYKANQQFIEQMFAIPEEAEENPEEEEDDI